MIGLEEIIIFAFGVGLIAFMALAVETKRFYRMLMYFLFANLCFLGILGIYGLWIIGGLIVLINMGVIAVFVFLTMILGERVEEE